jgi:hypothetical protein
MTDLVILGRGLAREPGNQEHGPTKTNIGQRSLIPGLDLRAIPE